MNEDIEEVDYEEEEYESEEKQSAAEIFGVRWKKPPSVTQLKQDYIDATPDHQAQITKITTWLDNLHMTGAAAVTKAKGKSGIAPKLIRKQAEWRYSSLTDPFLSTDDIYNIDPITYEDKESAIQNALVLNNQFNTKINKIKFLDDYVHAAVDEGTVIVRIGWDFSEEGREVEEIYEEMADVEDLELANAMVAKGQQPRVPLKKIRKYKKMVTTVNKPTVQVVDYRNFVLDPSCEGDVDKAQFAIYMFQTSMAELEEEGDKYHNLDKIDIESNSPLSAPDGHQGNTTFNFKDKPRKKMVAFEYWGYRDVNGDGKLTAFVATWVGNTMIRLEENPFPDKKIPFVVVPYMPVKRSAYGEPDGELLADNQKVVGAVTRGMIDLLGRSANSQQGIRKDALDYTNRRKFDNGQDYEFNPGVRPEEAFYMHKYPEIPHSAITMLGVQQAEAESMSGVKAFTNGISGESLGSTATGARSALDAASKRELGLLRRLADGMVKIGRKIVSMNSEFLEEEEVVRVTNEEFVTVRRDDLAGNFDLKLTISTAEADNEKAQELAFMLQTLGNKIDPTLSKLILTDIARLRKMPRLAKQISEWEPQADPLDQERKTLEIELLKAQIQNEYAKGQENQVDVGLKQAKTQTELGKARNLNSKSDQQDLDYLDNMSGNKRTRELEDKEFDRRSKLDEQAAGAILGSDSNNKKETPQPYRSLSL